MKLPDLPAQAAQLLESARRVETPCGAGKTVWHIWGDDRAGLAPVVLLHGGSGSWTHWLRNIPAIVASGRMAVVPDLPGFGDSDAPPGGGDADAVVAPIASGLRELFGEGPFDLVAFSFGSLVAVLLAVQHPELVRSLAMVGAPVIPLKRARGPGLKPWSRNSTQHEREVIHRHNLAALMLHRAESIDELAVALQSANVPRDRMRGRSLVTTHAFRDAVSLVQCSFSAIYGEQDVLYRGMWDEVGEALASGARYEAIALIPQAGHWVQFEEAARFNAWLLSWLTGSRTPE
ncbi:alpha/beta fold hydrolase [Caenimonas sp. SL110]|uniref:alpha/beta fold hydrolase n=1 Tax=Caenimonas sp. SL110 TaxID=1450524 RepID=UPI00065482C1|nr:alpha/beta fold hydrolase [Caenimonas sp. SL110]